MSEDIFKLYQEFTKNKYRTNGPNELTPNPNIHLTTSASNTITNSAASKINYLNLNINDLKNNNKPEQGINQSDPFKVFLPNTTNNNFDILSANDKYIINFVYDFYKY